MDYKNSDFLARFNLFQHIFIMSSSPEYSLAGWADREHFFRVRYIIGDPVLCTISRDFFQSLVADKTAGEDLVGLDFDVIMFFDLFELIDGIVLAYKE